MKEIILEQIAADEAGMLALGAKLAGVCTKKAVIFLQGNLGAGKTTFARGFLKGLGYTGKVKSPTYTLVEPYELAEGQLYHFDLYRIHDADELEFMGIQDYFGPNNICLLEWPEHAENRLPMPDIACIFTIQKEQRTIKIVGKTEVGNSILERFAYEK